MVGSHMTFRKPGQRLFAATPFEQTESLITPVMTTRPFAMQSMAMNH
jgi:hypothetical protein